MGGVGHSRCHSLGGAFASIAALSIKTNIQSVRLFTYGALSTWADSKRQESKPNFEYHASRPYADPVEAIVGRQHISPTIAHIRRGIIVYGCSR